MENYDVWAKTFPPYKHFQDSLSKWPGPFDMKPISRAAVALFPLFLAGCARQRPATTDERAALQQQAGREIAQVGQAESQGAAKSLAGARLSGGQIQIGDAQGRPLYRIAAREIRALSGGGKASGSLAGALALDARATLFKSGQSESSFKADTIQLFNAPKGARLQMTGRVVATSQHLPGAPVEVSAPRADIDINKRLLVASGGCVAKRGPITLKTPQLRGQSSLETLSCNDALVVAPGAQVKAKTALFNWKANRLSAQTVSATRPGLLLSGARLDADTLASHGTLTGGVSAKGQNGVARGPRLDFNWKNDRLFVPDATFESQGGTARIAALTTDSKLRVTDAQQVRIQQNGATLTARSARGFDSLSRLNANGVVVVRGDLRIEANRAQARDWSKQNGTVVGSGGVVARNRAGTISAQNATWTGDAQNGRVSASGNVVIRGEQGTLRGQNATVVIRGEQGTSRGQNAMRATRFENAELSGSVSGILRDKTRISASRLEKRGERYIASGGASAKLPDGTSLRAARVEGSGQNAVATGGASGHLPDGTQLSASRVEKRGENIVASGGAQGRLPDGTMLRADHVEKRGQLVVATGGARADVPAVRGVGRVQVRAARVEGPADGSQIRASGGVVLIAQNGAVVRAPHALFDRRAGKVTASGGVSVKDPVRGTLVGESLVADLGLKQITVLRGQGKTQAGTLNLKNLF